MRRSTCNRLPAAGTTIRPQAHVPDFIATAMVKPRAGLKGDAAVTQLADDMRQAGQREGGVTETDLELLGWTKSQLIELGKSANIRAQRLAGATA
jgi:hypothetical protein